MKKQCWRFTLTPGRGMIGAIWFVMAHITLPTVFKSLHIGPQGGWPFWVLVAMANVSCFTLIVGMAAALTGDRLPPLINRIWMAAFLLSVGYGVGRLLLPSPVRAARAGDIERLEWGTAFAENLNLCDGSDQQTPLTAAIIARQTATVKRLVELGVNIDRHDGSGDWPLLAARRTNQPVIVTYLLQHGANEAGQANPNRSAWAVFARKFK